MGSQKSQTQLSTNTQAQLQTDTLTPTRALGKDGGSWSSISHTTEMSLLLSWLASGLTPLQTVPLPCSEPPMHASLVAQTVCSAGDRGSILSQEDPPRREWLPLYYSHLEHPMDRGAWQAAVPGVAKNTFTFPPKQESLHVHIF